MIYNQALDIPYEKQEKGAGGRRMCGAAALCMVYRSFGLVCTQEAVWERIARKDRQGRWCARTHLLAKDCLRHGLAAAVVQVTESWRFLRHCFARDIRVILNHRLRVASGAGHYSVLVGMEEEVAVVHDPLLGPDRRLPKALLLELWGRRDDKAEIAGSVAVAVGPSADIRPVMRRTCPFCAETILLQPESLFSAARLADGPALVQRLFCPNCDTVVI